MYTTGYEFFSDMVIQYGKKKALSLADEYLTMQEDDDRKNGRFKSDPEEFLFCRELWQAMTATKTAMKPESLNS